MNQDVDVQKMPQARHMSDQLGVTVTQHRPGEYSWCLTRAPGPTSPSVCVIESAARFADYEQAMDEGFEALKELRCPQNARLL